LSENVFWVYAGSHVIHRELRYKNSKMESWWFLQMYMQRDRLSPSLQTQTTH